MAEKEYIEREKLKQAFAADTQSIRGWDVDLFDLLMDEINEVPAADVAEVVRCKDCKWYKESKLLAPNKFCFRLKDRNGDPIGYNFSPNEFCSYGERKELDNAKLH